MQDAFSMLSDATGLNGTGVSKPVPLFYRTLMASLPPVVRSLTNVRYLGLDRLPRNGPVILAGNHTSHIDPIVVIMGARIPVRYLAKTEHFNGGFTKFVMLSTGRLTPTESQGVLKPCLLLWTCLVMMDGWEYFQRGPFPAYFPSFPSERKDWDSEVSCKIPHASVVPYA